MANRTISFLLTGHPNPLKINPKWSVTYKQRSTHNVYSSSTISAVYGSTVPTNLGYPVGEKELHHLNSRFHSPLVDKVLQYRTDSKLLGTYVMPFLDSSRIQSNIYPKLNTTATNTGRLSSTNPNGQNIPPTARELVCSDNKDQELVEVDFSQIEMVGVATLSNDLQLIEDLTQGEDLHFNTGKRVMGWKTPSDMTKEKRTLVKNVNFGVLYGGKAAGLSKQTGVEKSLVQSLINSFYNRYPNVKAWQEVVYKNVVSTMVVHDIKEGEQRYKSQYVIPNSDRKITFVESKAPQWLSRKTGRGHSFSPQQTSNYPIQGFAGGDMVMSGLVYLWAMVRATNMQDKIKFRMTVHDSIVMQVEKGVNLSKLLDSMCEHITKKFNIPCGLKYKVTQGSHWK